MLASQAIFTVLPIRVGRALARLAGRLGYRAVQSRKFAPLRGDQLYDLICMATFILSVAFLWTLNAGAIYFWMKDLNQEWLKLQVIYTAVEIFDKVHPRLFQRLHENLRQDQGKYLNAWAVLSLGSLTNSFGWQASTKVKMQAVTSLSKGLPDKSASAQEVHND